MEQRLSSMSEIPDKKIGECIIRMGPMFSGKSTQLRLELSEISDLGKKALYINHVCDRERQDKTEFISCHGSIFNDTNDNFDKIDTDILSKVDVSEYDIIGIDEGQFFSDLNITVRDWVLNLGKDVHISSLDSDSNLNPFGQIFELIPICVENNVIRLSSKCVRCLNNGKNNVKATTSFKYVDNNETQVDIGANDKYTALCLKCHYNLTCYREDGGELNISELII